MLGPVLHAKGMGISDAVHDCSNASLQHKELLQPGRGGSITEGKMVSVLLNRAQAYLPDLVVTGMNLPGLILCTLCRQL